MILSESDKTYNLMPGNDLTLIRPQTLCVAISNHDEGSKLLRNACQYLTRLRGATSQKEITTSLDAMQNYKQRR